MTLGKNAGEIGPSTIVGSGAYNLYMITAFCTLCLPAGQFKKIKHVKVFIWTTTWSMWAHLWLWIVYKQITPDQIDVWEAYVTLGFMPLFVWTTWLVDTRGWNWFAPHKHVSRVCMLACVRICQHPSPAVPSYFLSAFTLVSGLETQPCAPFAEHRVPRVPRGF